MNTKEEYIRQLQKKSEDDLFKELNEVLHALGETVTLEKKLREEKCATLYKQWDLICDEVIARKREKEKQR
jgi:hypothetical protein